MPSSAAAGGSGLALFEAQPSLSRHRPAPRASATHKGSPSPHRLLGLGDWLQWLGVNSLISLPQGSLLYLWEQTMYIRRELGANFVGELSRISCKVLLSNNHVAAISRSLVFLTALVGLCSFARADEPDERVVRALSRSSSLSDQEIRESYKACDSGVTRSMTICVAYGQRAQELRLNEVYLEVLKNVKGTGAEKKLLKAQRAWLAYRITSCDYESDGWAGGTGHGMIELSCLTTLARDRVQQLEKYAQCKQPSCPGEW